MRSRGSTILRLHSDLHLRLRWLLPLGVFVPLLAVAAPSGYAASAGALPPGVTEVQVTNDPTHRWGEPEVAVNPTNPNNLVYAILGVAFTNECLEKAATDPASNCALVDTAYRQQPIGLMHNVPNFSLVSVFVSFDRGKTWKKSTDLPGQIPVFPRGNQGQGLSGDPMVTAGPDGTFYIGWDALHFANLPSAITDYGGIGASKSTDGGRSWSDPVLTGTTVDRPFMKVDLATGVVYEASSGRAPGPTASGDPTTPATGAADRHLVSSKDGVHWTKPEPFGGVTGTMAQMGAAHGIVATAFKTTERSNALCGTAPTPCTIFQTTTDAGTNWSRQVLSIPSTYTGNPLVAADPSKPGHFAIAVLTNSDTHFAVYQTPDSGKTWSGPTIVTDDPGKTHYHGWMAYSPKGVLGVTWKTREASPGGTTLAPFNVFAVISKDGGATFSRPLKINSAQYQAPDSRPFAESGDCCSYLAMSADDLFVAYATSGDKIGMFSVVKLDAFKQETTH
jgi:hypothetical protein